MSFRRSGRRRQRRAQVRVFRLVSSLFSPSSCQGGLSHDGAWTSGHTANPAARNIQREQGKENPSSKQHGASSASSLGVSPGMQLLSPRRRAIYACARAGMTPSCHM